MKAQIRTLLAAAACTAASYAGPIVPSFVPTVNTPEEKDPQWQLAHDVFKRYNPSLHDKTVDVFMNVVKAYELDDDLLFKHCIGQICLESSAKQSSESPTGAIGLGQVVPTTAFDVLHRITPSEERRMMRLGAGSIKWALQGSYSTYEVDGQERKYISSRLRKKAIAWLNDPTNNLILWGHMMGSYVSSMGRDRALLAYRLGEGGGLSYSGPPRSHPYVLGIRRIVASMDDKSKKGA